VTALFEHDCGCRTLKHGEVARITARGTYVRFDDGTARNVAWWRLSREEQK
jgi:hypothetical protein